MKIWLQREIKDKFKNMKMQTIHENPAEKVK